MQKRPVRWVGLRTVQKWALGIGLSLALQIGSAGGLAAAETPTQPLPAPGIPTTPVVPGKPAVPSALPGASTLPAGAASTPTDGVNASAVSATGTKLESPADKPAPTAPLWVLVLLVLFLGWRTLRAGLRSKA